MCSLIDMLTLRENQQKDFNKMEFFTLPLKLTAEAQVGSIPIQMGKLVK